MTVVHNDPADLDAEVAPRRFGPPTGSGPPRDARHMTMAYSR